QLVRRRRLRRPAAHQLLVRHPVKRVVDLDGREPRRVVGQHLRRREIRRIEGALPLRVVITRGPNPDHGCWLSITRARRGPERTALHLTRLPYPTHLTRTTHST